MKGKIAFTKLFRNHGGGIKRGVEKKWAEHFNQILEHRKICGEQ